MLNPLPDIRPEERRATLAALFTLLGMMASHALLETARDALFLAKLPAQRLPWVYLTVALIAFGAFSLQQILGRSASQKLRLLTSLLASSGITFVFWLLAARQEDWVLFALYVWAGVLASLLGVRFWTLLGELFTVSEAKRLYAVIGAGSVLGAILGSALARLLVMELDPRHLILASGLTLAVTAIGPGFLLPRPDAPPSPRRRPRTERLFHPLRTVWHRPYLRRVGALLLLSTLTLTLVDYVFKSLVSESIPPERLGAFFASAYLAFNLISLLVQVFLVGLLVRSLGVGGVLSILPALLILGGVGVAAGLGLAAAVVLKAFDGSLRYSLHRTTAEVLYVPLSTELRNRVKGIMDVLGQRGGQVLASLGILGVVAAAGAHHERILALVVVLLAGAWVLLARALLEPYLGLFRETLSEVSLESRFEFPALDLASLETLIAALSSPKDAEVLAALGLLAEQERTHLIPALILYHPSTPVVIRALELFSQAGREDFVPMTDRLLSHEDPEVRAATLRARAWVAPDTELFDRLGKDPSSVVRSTALVGMISYGSPRAGDARRAVEGIAATGNRTDQLALARAIRASPGAAYEPVLLTLGKSPYPDVREAVVLAMGEVLSFAFIPTLLRMLPERNTRNAARSTLVALGNQALAELEAALEDSTLALRIRRQLPRVIGDLGSEEAARVLQERFAREQDGGVRYRILRGLGRMRRRNPDLPLDTELLEAGVRETLEHIFWVLDARVLLEAGVEADPRRGTPVQGLILSLLSHKEDLAVERLFRLLGLLHPFEDLRSMYRGVRSRNRALRSSSTELLENLLESPLRGAVLAVVEDLPDAVRVQRSGPYFRRRGRDYDGTLRELLSRGGVGTRCLVAYHVGELGIPGLLDDLSRLPIDEGGLLPQVVARAFRLARSAQETDGVS
jgi:AAA family ATP:ADP antiporter